MGRTIIPAKLFVCFVAAIAVPWFVKGEDDHGHTNARTEASGDHVAAADAHEYAHNGETDSHGEEPAELEHLSEVLDSRMPESSEKLRLSVSADHPITSETHGYEERTFIDVSFPPGESGKPIHSASNTHGADAAGSNSQESSAVADAAGSSHEVSGGSFDDETQDLFSDPDIADDHHSPLSKEEDPSEVDTHTGWHELEFHSETPLEKDVHVVAETLPHQQITENVHGHEGENPAEHETHETVHEPYHDTGTSNAHQPDIFSDSGHGPSGNTNNSTSSNFYEQQQLPFPHTAEISYGELSEQLHDRTFDLIKAEIRGDPELIQSSIYQMTQSLQSIIDRASHPASPEPSQVIDSAARAMAIHLDRIDFALSQENKRKVSLLVGKVAAKVKELEGIMETEGGRNPVGAPTIVNNGEHHAADDAASNDSHDGVHH